MKHPKEISLPYRACVGLMMINNHGKIFMGQRMDTLQQPWQMPQGGIDANEDIEKAALRELYEETGVTSASILAISNTWHSYDIPLFLRPKLWNGLYRGQTQKWFLIKFDGVDDEIDLSIMPIGSNPFIAHQEFIHWKWVECNDVPNLAVKFKRSIYQSVIDEFQPIIKTYTHKDI